MEISDIEGERSLTIDAKTGERNLFISGPMGFCMEFDRAQFVSAMAEEFDLMPAGLLATFVRVS